MLWDNTNNQEVLVRARAEIVRSWRETCELNKSHPQAAELFNSDKLPAFHDPFAGGGAIPLEAQRLGLESYASDLNPVAVTINKAMIEIPPKFAGRAPIGPRLVGDKQGKLSEDWSGARGLAEDVRRYGAWMRAEAEKRIGHLYPKIEITAAMAADRADLKPLLGQKITVIAWLWARTVRSPNPAFSNTATPLSSTFVLSSKVGKEAYIEPVLEEGGYRFEIRIGTPPDSAKAGTKLARGANFRCLLSGSPIEPAYIKAEGVAGRMGSRLMAIVAEGVRGRVFLDPSVFHEKIARTASPDWKPDTPLPNDPRSFWTLSYGLTHLRDLFTPRQLVALTTYSDLVQEAIAKIHVDALAAGMANDDLGLDARGTGALAYAQAVGVYLGVAVDKTTDYNSSLVAWSPSRDQAKTTFGRQALPMIWDYAEVNTLAGAAGDFEVSVAGICRAMPALASTEHGFAQHADAQSQ